jgi:hypothetical protein
MRWLWLEQVSPVEVSEMLRPTEKRIGNPELGGPPIYVWDQKLVPASKLDFFP